MGQLDVRSEAQEIVHHIITTEVNTTQGEKRRFMLSTLFLVGRVRFHSEEVIVGALLAEGVEIRVIREAIQDYVQDFGAGEPHLARKLESCLVIG